MCIYTITLLLWCLSRDLWPRALPSQQVSWRTTSTRRPWWCRWFAPRVGSSYRGPPSRPSSACQVTNAVSRSAAHLGVSLSPGGQPLTRGSAAHLGVSLSPGGQPLTRGSASHPGVSLSPGGQLVPSVWSPPLLTCALLSPQWLWRTSCSWWRFLVRRFSWWSVRTTNRKQSPRRDTQDVGTV